MAKPAATQFLIGSIITVGAIAAWHMLTIGSIEVDLEVTDGSSARNESALATTQWAFETPELKAYKSVKEKPIFHASRTYMERPVKDKSDRVANKAASPAPPDAKTILSRMILVGTIVVGNDQKAIFKKTPQSEGEMLSVGDAVAGWKVASIDKEAVHFVTEGDQYRLLFPDVKE